MEFHPFLPFSFPGGGGRERGVGGRGFELEEVCKRLSTFVAPFDLFSREIELSADCPSFLLLLLLGFRAKFFFHGYSRRLLTAASAWDDKRN